jgi:RNase P subunit RPR2
MISAYCGNCDKQIELTKRSVVKEHDDEGNLYVNIICPRCNDYEEILIERKK